jgi:hypothetical protein
VDFEFVKPGQNNSASYNSSFLMEYWMFLGVAYIQFDINETIE